ncbi:MAG: AsmA family protein, partial [Burkholderiales bacterium]
MASRKMMPPRDASRQAFSRVLRWSAWAVLTLLVCIAVGFAYITFVGITVDGTFLRARIAQAFSESIGRAVRFDGPMEIEVSARPRLRVGGLHIANAPGFGGGDFASLGEARLAVDLWPLLFEKQLRIDELAGNDVQIRLQSRDDGSNNWTLYRPTRATGTESASRTRSGPGTSVSAGQAATLLDIQRIVLEQLNVEYVANNGTSHFFDLHSLVAQSPANAPLRMTLDGTVEKQFPYHMEFTGGMMSELTNDKPWPISFTVTFLSSTLSVSGSVSGNGAGDVSFGLGTENLMEVERLLQIDLPDVGASGISAMVDFSPRRVQLRQLSAAMGETAFTGDLDFDITGPRPKLTGSLTAQTLDLRPFIGEQQGAGSSRAKLKQPDHKAEAEPPRDLADLYRSLATATFDLKRMNDFDADVALGVQRWLSLPGDVKDARLRIHLQDGILRAPVTASMTGVRLNGEVIADATATPPKFDLQLGTSNSELGGLAYLLFGIPGVEGQLGRFDFKLVAQGDRGSDLVQSLDVKLRVGRGRFSYGNVADGNPVSFSLDKFVLHLPPGKGLAANAQGTLVGQPFDAILAGGALEPMMLQGSGPLDLRLRSGQVRARIHGRIGAPAADGGTALAFEFAAPRAGEFARWFGFEPGAQIPANISGKASVRVASWQLRDLIIRLGRTSVKIDLSQSIVDGSRHLQVSLDSDLIDLTELESALPEFGKAPSAKSGTNLDIPVLPTQIDLGDADIAVNIRQFSGAPVAVRDVAFDGRIRDGYMYPSPFSANVANAGFNGAVLLDLRSAEPVAGLWLYAADIDVGSVLRSFGIARNLEAGFNQFAVNLVARSSRLSGMLARSELIGAVGGGRIVLRDANTKGKATVTVDKGELRADPGKPVRLALNGGLDGIPISISVETAPANELANPGLPLHFTLLANAANSDVKFTGNVARPIGTDVQLALDARGKLFSDLDALTRTSLPPWGPWSANGKFRISPRGYEVNDLRLQVGESKLDGQGRLDTQTGRPRIAVVLTSPVIQLNDFRFGDWSPIEKRPQTREPGTPAAQPSAEEVRRKAAAASDKAQTLLSPEALRRQDVLLDVEVRQVLSGNDKLGAGRMRARLENGRADIGPIEVEIPGGGARLQLGYEPTEQDVHADLHIDVSRFDYGVLARRIEPGTDLGGTFSLKVDVDSRARYLSEILRHGTGRIDFAIWPHNMQAGIIDMWAVNVLIALASEVDSDKASRVNCAVGRFKLDNGILTDEGIILDTSKIRVTGTGKADFTKEQFALRMRPQSKAVQFFSLATP